MDTIATHDISTSKTLVNALTGWKLVILMTIIKMLLF